MAYEIVTLGGKEIEVDEDGFIQQPELWDKDVARDLAQQDGDRSLAGGVLYPQLLVEI